MPAKYPSTDRLLPATRKRRPSIAMFLLGMIVGMAGVVFVAGSSLNMEEVKEIFAPPIRPYSAYVEALQQSQVSQSVMGQAWLQAGEDALTDSTQLLPPHQERGYMAPLEQPVISYKIKPRKGQLLSVQLELLSVLDSPQVFIELFEQREGHPPQLVAFADSGSYQLAYQVEADEVYQLRIQPELLARFRYRLEVVLGASLAFPVEGKDSRAIRSFWGDPRDGGRRKHKGIDIFAKRGTPVLAAADGRVSRVKEGGLGGKVVWQRDASNQFSLYYAHLDTQWVRNGQLVSVGDTLGLVGNTGNARSTPPHLHFGIYQRRRGAVDPFPFVDQPDQIPPEIVAEDAGLLAWYRVKTESSVLLAPSSKATIIQEVPAETPVQRLAAIGKWHLVRLLDGTKGFVFSSETVPTDSPLEILTLSHGQALYDLGKENMIQDSLVAGSELEVLARMADRQLVRTDGGQVGVVGE